MEVHACHKQHAQNADLVEENKEWAKYDILAFAGSVKEP